MLDILMTEVMLGDLLAILVGWGVGSLMWEHFTPRVNLFLFACAIVGLSLG